MLAITARLCPSHPAAIHSPMYSLLTSHHFLSRLPQTRTATKSFDLAKISHVTVHNNNDQSGRQPHITQSSHQENPIGFGSSSSFLSHRPTPCSHLSSGRPALALAGHPTAPASAASKPPCPLVRGHMASEAQPSTSSALLIHYHTTRARYACHPVFQPRCTASRTFASTII